MRVLHSLLLATLASPALTPAADVAIPGPWSVRVGVLVPSSELRDATSSSGMTVGGGLILPQRGLVGRLGGDIDVRSTSSGFIRFDALSGAYMERFAIAEQAYLGAGAGLTVMRLRTRDLVVVAARPFAKGVVGWVVPWRPPASRASLAVEAAVFASPAVSDISTWGGTVGGVYGF